MYAIKSTRKLYIYAQIENSFEIASSQGSDFIVKFAMGIKENQDKLCTLYGLLKLHKRP